MFQACSLYLLFTFTLCHSVRKEKFLLCYRIEATCLSIKVYCDVWVLLRERVTNINTENNETTGGHFMDSGLCSFITRHVKELRWPGSPTASVCVYARVYVFVLVDWAAYSCYSWLLCKWEACWKGGMDAKEEIDDQLSIKSVVAFREYFILPLGVLLNGNKLSE